MGFLFLVFFLLLLPSSSRPPPRPPPHSLSLSLSLTHSRGRMWSAKGVGCTPWRPLRCPSGVPWSPLLLRGRRGTMCTVKGSDVRPGVPPVSLHMLWSLSTLLHFALMLRFFTTLGCSRLSTLRFGLTRAMALSQGMKCGKRRSLRGWIFSKPSRRNGLNCGTDMQLWRPLSGRTWWIKSQLRPIQSPAPNFSVQTMMRCAQRKSRHSAVSLDGVSRQDVMSLHPLKLLAC